LETFFVFSTHRTQSHIPINNVTRMTEAKSKSATTHSSRPANASPASRGLFFLLEGCDKTGKTTQASLLYDALLKRYPGKVKFMRFPNRSTEIGKLIDACLKKEKRLPPRSLCLLFQANRHELAQQMQDDLKAGIHLVVDRYSFSGEYNQTFSLIVLIWIASRGCLRHGEWST